jgi:hypothetical protein
MRLRNMKIQPVLFALTALFSGTTCFEGSAVAQTPAATPTPISCPTGFVGTFADPQLVYPAAGATMVPTKLGEIIVSGIAQGAFTLVTPSSSPLAIGPIESVASPAPTTLSARTSPSLYHAIPVPVLSPGITYSVVFTATALPCGPRQKSGTIGSFGT